MNPEIANAARTYFDQIAKGKKAGYVASATEKEAYARELTGGKAGYADLEALSDKLHDDGGNGVASAIQGFTSNFGDEITRILPKFLGGGANAQEEMRLRGDFMRREHPVGDAALQMAGALPAAMMLPFGGAVKGASLASKVASGARVGAAFGAANGAGSGEDTESRILGAGVGFGAGAALGAAVPKVFASRAAARIGQMFRPDAAPDLSMLPNNSPIAQIVAPLERVRGTLEKSIADLGGYGKARVAIREQVEAGRGDEFRFADLGKPQTALADFAATNSPKAHAALSDIVEQRGEGSTQRVIDDFKNAVGDQHAPSRQAELAAETKAWADGPDGYGTETNGLGLRGRMSGKTVPLGDAEPLVNQPRIRGMWTQAKATGQIGPRPENVEAAALATARLADPELDKFLTVNPTLNLGKMASDPDVVAQLTMLGKGHLIDAIKKARGASFDNVQDLHSSLSDAADIAFNKGATNLAHRMRTSADLVAKTLEEHVPGYADIVDKYAARKGLENALEAGVEWFHKSGDVTGLNKLVKSMSPSQLAEFRRGLASEQIKSLQSMQATNAATKAMIAKNAPGRQNMLEIVFGDEALYDKFIAQAKAERQLHKLSSAVGGSQTAGREAAKDYALGAIGSELERPHPSVKHALWKKIQKYTVGPILQEKADALLPHLETQGEAANLELLGLLENAAQKRAGKVGAGSTRAAPSAVGSLFGSQRSPE